MPTLVQLPLNFAEVDPNKKLPDEGEHVVQVRYAGLDGSQIVRVRYQILEGSDKGMLVDQLYNLDNVYGLRHFKQLMLVLGLEADNGTVDVESIAGRQLLVTIAHRDHNQTSYANVVEHGTRP